MPRISSHIRACLLLLFTDAGQGKPAERTNKYVSNGETAVRRGKKQNETWSRNTGCFSLLAMAIMVSSFTFSSAHAQEAPKTEQSQKSKQFPNLIFKDENGESHTIVGEQSNKVTLVHFWATWCGPCVREFPKIDQLQTHYGPKGLKVIAISLDGPDNLEKVKDFYKRVNVQSLKIFMDTGMTLKTIRMPALPTTFFLDSKGNVAHAIMGALRWDDYELRDFIERALDDPAPAKIN